MIFRTQLCGAAFGSNFAGQLSGAALENSFGELLWGTGLKHSSFGKTALRPCFREQLWEAAAGNHFGRLEEVQLWGNSFGATALGSSFGEQLRGTALENSFGEQLWTAYRHSFVEHLLWKQLSGLTFTRNFGGQFSVPILRSSFGALLLGELLGAWDSSSGAISGMSLGEQISGTILGSSFAKNFLEQSWGATTPGTTFDDTSCEQLSGRNFGKPLWEGIFDNNFGGV